MLLSDKIMIVAEISANHGHDIEIVKSSIRKAHEIGCDAVKIQTFRPDTITMDCDNDYFRLDTGTIWDGKTLFDLYDEAYMPWEWHEELFKFADEIGIILFSTPFDFTAVDLLEKCNNPIYKIASTEINDIPLIRYAAGKGKPMILSTGIAVEQEIRDAVEACRAEGNNDIYLLQCATQYPAKIENANLNTMTDMAVRFNCRVGLSDHSIGAEVPVVAASMGAEIIEKHFIIDKRIGGPDASFSMEPEQFSDMIKAVRRTEIIKGKVTYDIDEQKKGSRKYKRSLFVTCDVKKGDIVSGENVRSIRPSGGLEPKEYYNVIGRSFNRDIVAGTPLTMEILD